MTFTPSDNGDGREEEEEEEMVGGGGGCRGAEY